MLLVSNAANYAYLLFSTQKIRNTLLKLDLEQLYSLCLPDSFLACPSKYPFSAMPA